MSGTKNNISILDEFFTPAYAKIVKMVEEGLTQKQMAAKLSISPQNLSYRVKKLKKSGVMVDGTRSISKGLVINPGLDQGVKAKILSFEERAPNWGRRIQCNVHHISVSYPVLRNDGVALLHTRSRWKGKLSQELVEVDGTFFNVVLTTRNLIVKFQEGFVVLVESNAFQKQIIDSGVNLIFGFSEAIKDRYATNGFVLGTPKLNASFAFSDKLARKIIQEGVRVTVRKNGVRGEIDASKGHFRPKGEIEFTGIGAVWSAKKYIEKFLDKSLEDGSEE